MADQRSALDAERKRPTIEGAFASLPRLKAMQLPPMPHERGNADELPVIRCGAASDVGEGQYPGIDTMGFPHLREFLARLLQAQLFAQCRCFPSLFKGNQGEFVQGIVEPAFADCKRREAAVPPAPFAFARSGLNILHDKGTHREELAENRGNPQFPLPPCSGRWRELLFALLAVLAWLTTGGLSAPARAAHPGTVCLSFLDTLPGLCLHIEVSVRRRNDAIALALAARVNPNGNGLRFPCRWLN